MLFGYRFIVLLLANRANLRELVHCKLSHQGPAFSPRARQSRPRADARPATPHSSGAPARQPPGDWRDLVDKGLATCDMVILSGGTSKGAGDLCYRAISSFNDPGIVVHGVALKPGKPLCLAVTGGKPIVILPGFPTSAIFTFHEFVAPVIRAFAGLQPEQAERRPAILPIGVPSERRITAYLMVSLVRGDVEDTLAAYPNAKGSGAVTAFSQADGVITIGYQVCIVTACILVFVQSF